MNFLEQPPADQPMPAHRMVAHKQLVVDVITEGTVPRPRAARWAVPGLVAGLMLSGGVAVAAYVTSTPATVRGEIRCYTEVAPDGHYTSGVHVNDTDIADEAVALCAEQWRIGVLSAGSAEAQAPVVADPKQPGANADRPVPTLTACVLEDGVAAVFPGSAEVCERLGLPALQRQG